MAKKKTHAAAPWRNRIVGHSDVSPHEVVAHDLNWRGHPDAQRTALKTGIGRIGFIKSVTISKRTGRILDGHLRITLALTENQPTVPVEYVDLDEAEEREALLTLDSIAAMARAEQQQLHELTESIQMPEIDGYGQLLKELDGMIEAIQTDDGEVDDAESQPVDGSTQPRLDQRSSFDIVVKCKSESEQCRTLKKLRSLKLTCAPRI
jgi:hypothetical protein